VKIYVVLSGEELVMVYVVVSTGKTVELCSIPNRIEPGLDPGIAYNRIDLALRDRAAVKVESVK